MSWIGLAVALIGIAVGAAGVFRAFWPVIPGPEYRRLTPAARGVLEKKVRRDPNEPDRADRPPEQALLRTAAVIMLAQRNLVLLFAGCLLVQFGTTLADWNRVTVVITVLFAVPLGWLTQYVIARGDSGAAFLDRYADPVVITTDEADSEADPARELH